MGEKRYAKLTSSETIYDLAWCAPDAPYTAEQIAERIQRHSGIAVSPAECQQRMDAFWAAIGDRRVS